MVVLIHALGCDLGLWDRMVGDCPPEWRIIRYDLRGHGLSDCGPDPSSLGDHAQDAEALLEQLGIAEATFVGVSVGGLISLAVALRSPTRVRQLVVCATGARSGTPGGWSERITAVRTSGLESVADAIIARWFPRDFAAREPELLRGCRNRLVRTPRDGYLAACAALRDGDLGSRLREIAAPTLVLSGEFDAVSPPDLGQALAAGLPAARWELIAGSGHLPPLEQPAAFISALRRFLADPP